MLTKRFFAALAGLFVMGAAVASQGGKPSTEEVAFTALVGDVEKASSNDALKAAVDALVASPNISAADKLALQNAFTAFQAAVDKGDNSHDVSTVIAAAQAAKFTPVAVTSWSTKLSNGVNWLPNKLTSTQLLKNVFVYGTLAAAAYAVLGETFKNVLFPEDENEDDAAVVVPAA